MPVYAYTALESVLFAGPWLIRSGCGLKFSSGFESGRVGYLTSGLCIYNDPNCSEAWSVHCCLYNTVHYKERLKSFDRSGTLSLDFGRDIPMTAQKAM